MLILSRLFLSLKHTPWRAGSQRLGAREDESSQDYAAAAESGGRNPNEQRGLEQESRESGSRWW